MSKSFSCLCGEGRIIGVEMGKRYRLRIFFRGIREPYIKEVFLDSDRTPTPIEVENILSDRGGIPATDGSIIGWDINQTDVLEVHPVMGSGENLCLDCESFSVDISDDGDPVQTMGHCEKHSTERLIHDSCPDFSQREIG